MNAQLSQADLLWKDLTSEFYSDFVLFFFGKELHDSIDAEVAPDFLEQEFNETFIGNEPNKKVADKIMRFRLQNGESKFIILHIEFQGQSEKEFQLRMFLYFVYIVAKYKTLDISALVIYTGRTIPKSHDRFKMENFGTECLYKFNAYIVKNQDETKLSESDNPFALAVLASLYLIKAGRKNVAKLEYKKKLVEIAVTKNYSKQKFYRLFNFVQYLVTLPKSYELEFKKFTAQPKIDIQMQAKKEFLLDFPAFFGEAVTEIREEGIEIGMEKGMEKGIEKGIEKERARNEKGILNLYKNMGLSAAQIANTLELPFEYVQSIIDKNAS